MAEESGASAFFAKKKKGKKSFKAFNANKLDAASGLPAPIAEAAAASTADSAPAAEPTSDDSNNDVWADEREPEVAAIPTPLHKAPTVVAPAGASELLDMKALEEKRRGEDDVVERLRIQETKGMLQKAKEGMELEAKRLEEQKKASAAPAAAAAGGSKWVATGRRAGGSSLSSRFGQVSLAGGLPGSTAMPRKVNTQDEEAFPDLAMADKILEHKEKVENRPRYVMAKKNPTPVWNAPTGKAAPSVPKAVKADSIVVEPTVTVDPPAPKAEAPAPVSAPAAAAAGTAEGPKRVVKKKKKKDLSTFKAGGS